MHASLCDYVIPYAGKVVTDLAPYCIVLVELSCLLLTVVCSFIEIMVTCKSHSCIALTYDDICMCIALTSYQQLEQNVIYSLITYTQYPKYIQ